MIGALALAALIAQTPAGDNGLVEDTRPSHGARAVPDGTPSAPGVVAVARGSVSVVPAGQFESHGAAPGERLGAGSAIDVGASGWTEIHAYGARIRLGAGTRLALVRSSTTTAVLALARGRAWVQATDRDIMLRTLISWARIPARSSVIVDASPRLGLVVIPRRGSIVIADRTIVPGQSADVDPEGKIVVNIGGQTIADLVESEARAALRDPSGLRSFLLERTAIAPVGGLDVRQTTQVLRLGPEILGAHGGPTGASLEDALRPPAFFDEEVPSKGPNVRIEVEFAGE